MNHGFNRKIQMRKYLNIYLIKFRINFIIIIYLYICILKILKTEYKLMIVIICYYYFINIILYKLKSLLNDDNNNNNIELYQKHLNLKENM